jgi:hypothetical protein
MYIASAIAYDFALIKQFYLITIIIKQPFITYPGFKRRNFRLGPFFNKRAYYFALISSFI